MTERRGFRIWHLIASIWVVSQCMRAICIQLFRLMTPALHFHDTRNKSRWPFCIQCIYGAPCSYEVCRSCRNTGDSAVRIHHRGDISCVGQPNLSRGNGCRFGPGNHGPCNGSTQYWPSWLAAMRGVVVNLRKRKRRCCLLSVRACVMESKRQLLKLINLMLLPNAISSI